MECGSYCSHGGICEVIGPHTLHDSGYCQWTDDEAISKEEADDLFRLTGNKEGMTKDRVEFIIRWT